MKKLIEIFTSVKSSREADIALLKKIGILDKDGKLIKKKEPGFISRATDDIYLKGK